jgi:hypothetical protein
MAMSSAGTTLAGVTSGASGPLTNLDNLSLGVSVSSSTAAVIVATDGGVQILSSIATAFVYVDVFLFADTPAIGTTPATSRQIARRRIFASNPVAQQAVANWSFAVLDFPPILPASLAYTYRVAAQLVSYNVVVGALVSGSSTSPLRGTLTAVLINK